MLNGLHFHEVLGFALKLLLSGTDHYRDFEAWWFESLSWYWTLGILKKRKRRQTVVGGRVWRVRILLWAGERGNKGEQDVCLESGVRCPGKQKLCRQRLYHDHPQYFSSRKQHPSIWERQFRWFVLLRVLSLYMTELLSKSVFLYLFQELLPSLHCGHRNQCYCTFFM